MKRTLLTALLAFGVAAFPAMAGEPEVDKPDVDKAFNALDHDGDGYISRSEATGRSDLREHWATVDSDKDGKLTESEFSAFEDIPADSFPEK